MYHGGDTDVFEMLIFFFFFASVVLYVLPQVLLPRTSLHHHLMGKGHLKMATTGDFN